MMSERCQEWWAWHFCILIGQKMAWEAFGERDKGEDQAILGWREAISHDVGWCIRMSQRCQTMSQRCQHIHFECHDDVRRCFRMSWRCQTMSWRCQTMSSWYCDDIFRHFEALDHPFIYTKPLLSYWYYLYIGGLRALCLRVWPCCTGEGSTGGRPLCIQTLFASIPFITG